jgi:rhomboid protease GluP
MILFGARISMNIVEYGQLYRMVTAAFVHFDLGHLTGNMVLFTPFSLVNEMVFGKVATVVIYLITATFGSLFSTGFADDDYWSIGASGSVMGFIGAMTSILVVNFKGMRPETYFVIIVPMVVETWLLLINNLGAIGSGTDVLSHLGGYLSGLLFGIMICPILHHTGVQHNYVYVAKCRFFSGVIFFFFGVLSIYLSFGVNTYSFDSEDLDYCASSTG